MKSRHTLIALMLAALINCGGVERLTNAATRLTDDLAELLGMAGLVVEATVQATTVQTETANGIPLTLATLQVHRVYKGDAAVGSVITVESLGGVVGSQTVIACGQPQFTVGERTLVLLARSRTAPDHWRVLGGDIGQIILSQDKDGNPTARRACGLFEYHVRDTTSLTGYRRVDAAAVSAGQVRELVDAILKTGRPVLSSAGVAQVPNLRHDAHQCVAPLIGSASAHKQHSQIEGPSVALRLIFVLTVTTLAWAVSRRLQQMARPQLARRKP